MFRKALLLLPCLIVVLAPASALAQSKKPDWDFGVWGQMQVTSLHLMADAQHYGGTELQFNLSWKSLGGAIGLAYERLQPRDPGDSGVNHGGHLNLALQWRFVQLISRKWFHWIDPHLDIGAILGGVSERGIRRFRGAAYVGAGLDVRVLPTKYHAVLTVQYRFYLRQAPYERTLHFLVLGLGVRNSGG